MKIKLLTLIIIVGGIFILSANKPEKTIRVIESDNKKQFEKELQNYTEWGYTIISTNLAHYGYNNAYDTYHATLIK
jgi:hypothetical protein